MLNKINHDKILQDLDNDENNNFIKDMENLIKNNKNLNDDNYNNDDNDDNNDNNKNKNKKKFYKKYNYIIISLLVFMLLNNKSIIELIYYIPFVKDKIFLNLLIRTIIFGIILTLYKKLK
jgi:hypothetical protein